MNQNQPTVTYVPVDPYKYFNYALLHTHGLGFLFDTMRYDTAFLPRKADVDLILEAHAATFSHHDKPFSLLLCRYDWKGVTKPNWTPARLLSHQELQFLSDPMQVYQLLGTDPGFRPQRSLKFRAECVVTGTFSAIMGVMWDNRACPGQESHSRVLEDAIDGDPTQEITVQLVNYVPSADTPWIFRSLKK